MNLTSIELRYLRYFVALGEELSFRRAAERVYVSTPALSMQIKKLEDILEVTLCERNTTKIRLTVAGEVLLREARGLLQHTQKVLDITKEAAQGHVGLLRLGIPGRLSYSFIPKTMNAYRKQFPKVNITLLNIGMEGEQQEAVEEGRLHLGFAYGFQLPGLKDIEHLLVVDIPIRAVMGATHPLAASGQVSLADLARHTLLTVRRNSSQAQTMLTLFRKKRLKPKFVKNVDTFDACVAMLTAGEGVSLLPEMHVFSLAPNLVLLPVKDMPPSFRMQVYAIWRKSEKSPQVHNFVNLLRQAGVQHD